MTAPQSRSTALPDALLGQRIADRYRLIERIGSGGMSTVYRACDERLDREVALKVFRPELASAEDLRRQRDEVRILARLHHPSLVTLYDAVSDEDGRAALVLEYVPGNDVGTRIARGPLAPHSVAAIGRDVARALAHIHAHGIVHRDVSPGNILLPDSGTEDHGIEAKLTDLGIARLVDETRTSSTVGVIGTAHYLSPEQVQGEMLTPASDIYSLGLVLLECRTGERAFPGAAIESALARLSRDPSIPDQIDREWRELLAAMTRRDPERRPHAVQVAAALAELATRIDAAPDPDGPRGGAPPPAPQSWTEPTRRMPAAELGTATNAGMTAKTKRLPPAPPPDVVLDRPRRQRSSRRVRILLLVLVVLLAIAALSLAVLPGRDSAHAPAPAPSYPAVPGQLGDHLRQLEQHVDPGSP